MIFAFRYYDSFKEARDSVKINRQSSIQKTSNKDVDEESKDLEKDLEYGPDVNLNLGLKKRLSDKVKFSFYLWYFVDQINFWKTKISPKSSSMSFNL